MAPNLTKPFFTKKFLTLFSALSLNLNTTQFHAISVTASDHQPSIPPSPEILALQKTDPDAAQSQYLDFVSNQPGVTKLLSGLIYKPLTTDQGAGNEHPLPSTPCSCHYSGTLINGEKFDSSYDRGEPTTFAPNQVIKGWTEAMQYMVAGDKWELYIPYQLAYGENGSPPKIPGKSPLVFTLEMIELNGKGKEAMKCNVITKEKCSEKEVKYIEKMVSKATVAWQKEVDRLGGLILGTENVNMEQKSWIMNRMKLLKTMIDNEKKKESEEGEKKEL